MQEKLTEDQTVELLKSHLESKKWKIDSYCTGHKRGTDIIASNHKKEKLHIEVKGSKGSSKSHVTTRSKFSAGQIKTHFGVAIVKAMSLKLAHPTDRVAIAHPDDKEIRLVIGRMTHMLKNLGIEHYWVGSEGVSED